MGKWDNYVIGSIPWINSRRDRLSACPFVADTIKDKTIKNIIEIGGGELIEAKEITSARNDIIYSTIDVSKTFSDYAIDNGFISINGDFQKYDFDSLNLYRDITKFDMVYANHVLEHMNNVHLVIDKIKKIGKKYHVCMFKWRFVGNENLRPEWEKVKGFWSTHFNVWKIISLFGDTLDDIYITDKKNRRTDWAEYVDTQKGIDYHRDGNHYLHLVGGV